MVLLLVVARLRVSLADVAVLARFAAGESDFLPPLLSLPKQPSCLGVNVERYLSWIHSFRHNRRRNRSVPGVER